MFTWNAWAWQSHGSVTVEWEFMMSTTFFECPYYHEFRQLLEQSVQDTLLTGRKFVAANLSVSLLLAPYLGSDTGQADRQTDKSSLHNAPHPEAAGHNNVSLLLYWRAQFHLRHRIYSCQASTGGVV